MRDLGLEYLRFQREKETKARLMRSTLIVSTTGLAKKAMKEAEEAGLAAEADCHHDE